MDCILFILNLLGNLKVPKNLSLPPVFVLETSNFQKTFFYNLKGFECCDFKTITK